MFGIGKQMAWNAWVNFPRNHWNLHSHHTRPKQPQIWLTVYASSGRLTVLMYSEMCSANSVNETRMRMFTHGLKTLECIPPTLPAPSQNTKRALLISSFIWKQSLDKEPHIPNPAEWGWERSMRTKAWIPYWTTLLDASHGCTLLLHCGCSVACKGNCKCHMTGMRCSPLSKCEGGCTNNDIAT